MSGNVRYRTKMLPPKAPCIAKTTLKNVKQVLLKSNTTVRIGSVLVSLRTSAPLRLFIHFGTVTAELAEVRGEFRQSGHYLRILRYSKHPHPCAKIHSSLLFKIQRVLPRWDTLPLFSVFTRLLSQEERYGNT